MAHATRLHKHLTVEEYLALEQVGSVRHWRDDDGAWWTGELIQQGRLPAPCPDITLTYDDIYEGLDA